MACRSHRARTTPPQAGPPRRGRSATSTSRNRSCGYGRRTTRSTAHTRCGGGCGGRASPRPGSPWSGWCANWASPACGAGAGSAPLCWAGTSPPRRPTAGRWPASRMWRPGAGLSTSLSPSTSAHGPSPARLELERRDAQAHQARPRCPPDGAVAARPGRAPARAGPGAPHRSLEPPQYTSFAFTAHLTGAGTGASFGTAGDAPGDALMEPAVGLYKAELIKTGGPWKTLADAELATAGYVDWFNSKRLHTAVGDIPPAGHEATSYAQTQPDPVAGACQPP